jgi:hypothetical protein
MSASVAAMTQPPGGQQPPPPPQGQPYSPQQPYPQSGQSGQYGENSQYAENGQYGQPGPAQSQYGQNQYAQNQYGQQNYGAAPAGTTAESKGRFNVVAGVLAGIAAILGILSLFVLGWYRDNYNSVSGGSSASSGSKFSKIHDALQTAQNQIDAQPSAGKYIHFGLAPTYFSWLGYVLIIAAVVLAFIAAAPLGGAVVVVKFVAAIVALAGLGATFWAIDLISFDAALRSRLGNDAPSGYGDWLKHTSFGAWAMMLAFLLCFIAALLPPKRKTVVTTTPGGRY